VSAIVIANTVYAIDMNMQYVQSSNGLMLPDNTTPIETSAIERTIFGGGSFFTNTNSSLEWEVEFFEHLAFDYKSFSTASLSGILSYSFQTESSYDAPWFETGIEVSTLFGGNSQLSGNSAKIYLSKDRFWSDRVSTRGMGYVDSTLMNESDLSSTNVGVSGTLYFDASARSTFYTNTSMEMGKHLFSYSSDVNISHSISEKSITNVRMSEEFEQEWFSVAVDGLKVNSYFGLNSRISEDLSFDVAYNYAFTTATDYSSSQHKFLASFFVEF
jgi:hypothetical protein